MSDALRDQTCVVTGATSGIGRAISVALASAGATVCAVGRRTSELEATANLISVADRFEFYEADLVDEKQVARLTKALLARNRDLNILVHSAGTISVGELETSPVHELDLQYAVNIRAPYRLTQALLPALRATEGQIAFINSTAGLRARANVSQYASTKHALRAVADSLREEVNESGVRVLSVYPGRTATPLQANVHTIERRPYRAHCLVQPDDIAALVLSILTLPRTAEVTDVTIRPMLKP